MSNFFNTRKIFITFLRHYSLMICRSQMHHHSSQQWEDRIFQVKTRQGCLLWKENYEEHLLSTSAVSLTSKNQMLKWSIRNVLLSWQISVVIQFNQRNNRNTFSLPTGGHHVIETIVRHWNINLLLADSSTQSEQIKKAPWATANARSHNELPRVNDDQVRNLQNSFTDAALSCDRSVWLVERPKRILNSMRFDEPTMPPNILTVNWRWPPNRVSEKRKSNSASPLCISGISVARC